MKNKIVTTSVLMLLLVSAISAQIQIEGRQRTPGNAFTRVDAPPVYTNRNVLGKTATAGFNVLWTGTVPDSIRDCVLKAVDIWSYLLTTSQTVNIEIKYFSMQKQGGGNDTSTLASTRVDTFKNDFTGGINGMQYPLALARQLHSGFSASDTDMTININANIKWYKGTDGIPQANKQDLISTILHEIGHGLGLWGTMHVDGSGNGSFGVSGYKNSQSATYHDRYDYFGYSMGSKLIYRSNPSVLLGSYLKNNNVFFDGSNAIAAANGSMPKLYAPSSWKNGSSFSHLDEGEYPAGNSNSLFTPNGDDAEVIWTPGEIGLAMLKDLGWNVNRMIVFKNPLAAQEITRGSAITIKWYDNTSLAGSVNLKLYKQPAGTAPVFIQTIGSKESVPGFTNQFTWNVASNLEPANYFLTAEGAAPTAYGTTSVFKITNTVPMPTFSPAGGQHNIPSGQSLPVQLLTNVEGGVVRFTTNSSEPSKNSSQYVSGQPIYISATTTIKAKTYLTFPGGAMDSSTTATAIFTINSNSYIAYITCVSGYVHKTSSENSGESTNEFRLGITNNGTTRRGFIKVPIAQIQSQIPQNAVIESVDPILNFSPWTAIQNGNVTVKFKEITYDAHALTTYNNIGNSTVVFGTLPANSTKFNLSALIPKIQSIVNGTLNTLTIGMQNSDESNYSNEIYDAPPITLRIYYRGNVDVWQEDKNSVLHGNVQLWNGSAWENKGSSFTQFRTPSQPITLKGEQTVKTGTTEKYRFWLNNGSQDVINHNIFPVIAGQANTYISQFAEADNSVIIRNTVEGININASNIEFRDPWYIDYNDGAYGLRNRGMASAYPYVRSIGSTGFRPDATTNYPEGKYNGVFLDQTFASGKYYTVNSITPVISGLSLYFQNWSAISGQADFQNTNAQQTGVVFRQVNTTVTANYKAQLATNVSTNFTNSGQRKIVRTSDGTLHLFYESIGKVWYEQSTNGGASWCQPFSVDDIVGKLSSVCTYGSDIVLAYQKNIDGNAVIQIEKFTPYPGGIQQNSGNNQITTSAAYSSEITPAIISNDNDLLLVSWQENNYVKYQFFWITGSAITLPTQSPSGGTIGTVNTFTPAVAVTPGTGWPKVFHTAFEKRTATSSNIVYRTISVLSSSFNVAISTPTGLSSGSGYTWNYRPSIIAASGDIARVNWIGQRLNPSDPDIQENVSLLKISNGSSFWAYGNTLVTSTQINKSNNGFLLAYSNNGTIYHKNHVNYNSQPNPTISGISGGTVQVAEGLSNNSFYVAALNTTQQPYRFNVGSITLSKEQSHNIAIGRSGVIVQDDAEFYFVLGDISVDGEPVDFVSFHDSLKFPTVSDLNSVLTTQPFHLTNNSQFFYSVQYGTTDSINAVALFSDAKSASFTVELIDDQTNQVLGSYDQIAFNANNPTQYNNLAYQVNTEGIGNRTVRLRLVASYNGLDPAFGVTNRQATESVMGKRQEKQIKNISFKGSAAITEYALEQNYPNPFNPSTTINYALPKSGFVTLKVYDVLGREVATLVNDHKETGRYSVQFDGSKLSSGTYIYKLTAEKFSDVKKFVLVK